MMFTTKGRYALTLMLDIAFDQEGEPVKIKDIAKRQNISDKYLEQIVSVLHKAGMLTSIRGPKGGYSLTRSPEEYTVGEILRLTEGNLALAPCVEEDAQNPCIRQGQCVNTILWRKINDAINGVIDHVTLADMHQWQTEKIAEQPSQYV